MAFPNKIIVVGGSAGGVATLPKLLENFPAEFSAAIFVVLHIPVQADDLLAALIQRKTALRVHTAIDGQEIEAGHVYLAPPDHHLLIEGKWVRLSHGPRENRHRPAINPLFRSAAKFYGEQVIGVLITGQLEDGVIGLNAVKTHGGVAIVQNPDEASAPALVRNALRDVKVDYTLPVAEIASLLQELVATPHLRPLPAGDPASDPITDPPLGVENMMETIGSPVPYTCPACNGALWESKTGNAREYRCHVGHAYSPESLLIDQDYILEKALWSAIRIFEEQASLLRRLAKRNVTGPLLEKWNLRAEENEKNAAAIRALLQAKR